MTREGRGRARCAWNSVHTRAQRPGRTEAVLRIISPLVQLPACSRFAEIDSCVLFGPRSPRRSRFIQLPAPILHSLSGPLTPAFADSRALIELSLAPHPLLQTPGAKQNRRKRKLLFLSGLSVSFFFSHLSCCTRHLHVSGSASLALGHEREPELGQQSAGEAACGGTAGRREPRRGRYCGGAPWSREGWERGLSRMDGPEVQGQRPPVSPGGGPRRAGLSESLETISH